MTIIPAVKPKNITTPTLNGEMYIFFSVPPLDISPYSKENNKNNPDFKKSCRISVAASLMFDEEIYPQS